MKYFSFIIYPCLIIIFLLFKKYIPLEIFFLFFSYIFLFYPGNLIIYLLNIKFDFFFSQLISFILTGFLYLILIIIFISFHLTYNLLFYTILFICLILIILNFLKKPELVKKRFFILKKIEKKFLAICILISIVIVILFCNFYSIDGLYDIGYYYHCMKDNIVQNQNYIYKEYNNSPVYSYNYLYIILALLCKLFNFKPYLIFTLLPVILVSLSLIAVYFTARICFNITTAMFSLLIFLLYNIFSETLWLFLTITLHSLIVLFILYPVSILFLYLALQKKKNIYIILLVITSLNMLSIHPIGFVFLLLTFAAVIFLSFSKKISWPAFKILTIVLLSSGIFIFLKYRLFANSIFFTSDYLIKVLNSRYLTINSFFAPPPIRDIKINPRLFIVLAYALSAIFILKREKINRALFAGYPLIITIIAFVYPVNEYFIKIFSAIVYKRLCSGFLFYIVLGVCLYDLLKISFNKKKLFSFLSISVALIFICTLAYKKNINNMMKKYNLQIKRNFFNQKFDISLFGKVNIKQIKPLLDTLNKRSSGVVCADIVTNLFVLAETGNFVFLADEYHRPLAMADIDYEKRVQLYNKIYNPIIPPYIYRDKLFQYGIKYIIIHKEIKNFREIENKYYIDKNFKKIFENKQYILIEVLKER